MKLKLLSVFLLIMTVSFAQTITIAEARATAEGETVTTAGIVTTINFASSNSSEYVIQDSTGGIVIYKYGIDYNLLSGDLVEVTGEIDDYNGKLEVIPVDSADVTVVSSGNDLPAYQPVTITGLLANGESLESELVEIYNVDIVGGDDWPAENDNANITISDDDSANTVTLRIDRQTDLDGGTAPTATFDVRGIIGQYTSGAPDVGYQVQPRGFSDITTPDPGIITVAAARATAEGTTITTRGFITTPSFSGYSSDYVLQDGGAGIGIYGSGITPTLNEGDFITIEGSIGSYGGKIQVGPSDAGDMTVLATGAYLPAFQELTIAEILAAGEDYESELVTIILASIIDGVWPSSGSNANLTISDISDSSLTMRVDKDTDLDENLVPQGTFNVSGVIDEYNAYQIKPRYYADIEVLGDVSPVILDMVHTPENPIPTDIVTVTADVIDDGTVTVALNYKVGDGVFSAVAMVAGTGFSYSGAIPAQVDGSFVSYFISADDGVNAVVYSDTALYAVWEPSDLTPIYNIQYTTDPGGDSPFLGQEVTIGGVVTAEFWGSSSNRYIQVQDADSAWSGVVVFEYDGWDSFDFTTPLGDTVHSVAEGDSVVLTGTVNEYYGLTQILDVTEFVVYGTALQPFDPITVTAAEIMTGGTMAEAYEGVLVKVENVSVDDPDLGYGEWSFTDGTNSVMVDDIWDYYFDPADQALTEIVGVMTYSHDNTKLLPRLARDIVQTGIARFQRIQQVLYSDLLKTAGDAASDVSPVLGDTVTLTGIVTMPTGLSYAGDGIKFVFADPKGGPWSAILSYAPDSSAYPVLYEGDSIVATGYIAEYNTPPANMTELFITQPINLVGIGSAPPMTYVDAADLMYPTTAEQWGNVMVTLGASEVVEHGAMSSNDGGIKVNDGTGEVWVDHDSDDIWNLWNDGGFPDIGTQIDSIRGWIYHHFGAYADSTTYKLVPLWVADIALSEVGVDNDLQPESYALYQNYPNPFNPETQIQFRLAMDDKVTMIIYDISGRQVRTLVKDNFNAGLHSVTWDGKNNKGATVASGMYIYRINAGSFTAAQKMLLIR